MEQAQECVG
ncbi:hypothetical protein E2C01_060635 [Portunus trituberculatus]|uniref:Uncharacterized protein n=1 Tax=Portunus trituberculatus TaxID=210409 RepID=A0A5B7HB15_PORTR|nr:hypothetical protein [Portunus trituberculatus]